MRHSIIIAALFSTILLCSAQSGEIKESLQFEITESDLGDMKKSDKRKIVFRYTNVTNKPVVILDIKTSCGCTTAKYNKQPLQPSQADSVLLTFKPNDLGVFYKKVRVLDSEQNTHTLVIKGNVN